MADLTISVDIDAKGTAKGSAEAKAAIKGIRDSIAGVDVKALSEKLKSVGSQMQQFGGQLRNVGTSLTLAVTAPLVAAGAAILKAGGDYEKALNVFQAVTKATGDEMSRAASVAKDLGADLSLPATSAKDAALAMTELGKAGLSAADAMDAAKGVLQLAAAGQIDGARAAEIAANALNAFKLEAKDTTRVADLLAAAANASSAGVDDIALSMQQASANFASAKVPIEDLVTAISALANAGIKGSDAGTSLKTFIMSLQSPTAAAAETMTKLGISVFDTAGKMRSLPEIIGQFEQSLAGLTDEQKVQALNKIFGSDAIRAAQILFATGTEGFDKLKAAVTATGAAADLANAQMKGLSGAWAGFKSQLETIGITLYEAVKAPLTEFLQNAAVSAGQLGEAFSRLTPFMQQVIIGIAAIAAAGGPLLVVVGSLVSAIGTIVSAAGAISGAVAAVGGFAVVGPIIAVVAAGIAQLAIVAGVLYTAWTTNFGGIRELTQIVAQAIGEAWDAMMVALRDLTRDLLAEIQSFWQANSDDILEIIQVFSDGFRELWTGLVNFWLENGETIKEATKAVWNIVKETIVVAVRIIGDVLTILIKLLKGDWAAAWEATKKLITDVVGAWVRILESSVELVVAAVKLIFSGIWALNTWVIDKATELGRNIPQGLINGIYSMANPLAVAAQWMGDKVIDALKLRVKTESPSKVTTEIGQWVAEGLTNGIENGTPAAVGAANTIGSKVLGVFKTIVGGDIGGFIKNAFGILTDSSRSWGDRLQSIFSSIAQNFKRMVGDIQSTAGVGTASSGSGGGSILGQIFGSSGGGFNIPGDRTGTLDSDGNVVVDGRSILKKISGPGGLFGEQGFGNNVGTYSAIGGFANIAGGLIGGRVGGFISGAGSGLALGAQIGSMIAPGIGTAIGAVVGAIGGGLISLLSGDPKRKRDKNEKMPQLSQGFADALKQLRLLASNRNAIQSDPAGAASKADELRAAIASGFGIQFESKKYGKIAQQQIAQKLLEADALVKQIKDLAEVSKAANERERRMLPEFAHGVYLSPAFQSFRRRNGMLGGTFNGRDSLPSMLAPGEMVLNPRQMHSVRANAGFDVFKNAGIPGYAAGGIVSGQQSGGSELNVTIVVNQDATGMWHATAESDAGQKVIAKVVETKYANDEIKMARRGK